MNIPKYYLPIMPYLIITNARAFAGFMETVFGAKLDLIIDRTEVLIMHGELKIGGETSGGL